MYRRHPSFYKNVPILGICLGHRIIAFGGDIVRAERIKHGKTSRVKHNGMSIFSYATQPLTAMRYHSLVAEQTSLPECFDILATAMDDGEIMAVRHIIIRSSDYSFIRNQSQQKKAES